MPIEKPTLFQCLTFYIVSVDSIQNVMLHKKQGRTRKKTQTIDKRIAKDYAGIYPFRTKRFHRFIVCTVYGDIFSTPQCSNRRLA